MPREYRSRNRIVLDVLRAIHREPEIGTTYLLSLSNLSTERLQGYLAELVTKGLVVEEVGTRRSYRLTEAGERFLAELSRLERFMADFGMTL